MTRLLCLIAVLLLAGCAKPRPGKSTTIKASGEFVAAVKQEVADIGEFSTLASLGAEDADVIEVVMRCEDAMQVLVDDAFFGDDGIPSAESTTVRQLIDALAQGQTN